MKSIYASKLYKASKRKDRIQAALAAPSNLILVQQLADDLDDEYKPLLDEGSDSNDKKTDENEEVKFEDLVIDEDIDPDKDLVKLDDISDFKQSKGLSDKPSKDSSTKDKAESDKPDSDVSELMPDSPATDVNAEKAQKAEKAEASTEVLSATQVNPTQVGQCALEDIDLNVLKGTLNMREDTAGVSRITEKDDELWIYYNDDVNLNNTMTAVIEHLSNSGHKNLEFNRLARSDNAIVFVITKTIKDYPYKSLTEVD